ncbi:MAG: ABC transporter permease [Bacteroidales bacterium]|nr:ABC transporter permease [Bacteroidales bacterium]MCF8404786.1 ABC transporter permease [Bacteroidales bacterium]
MGKVFLIIKREYLTRVKKRSFIIMTIVGPLLMAALFVVPVYIGQIEGETKVIGVLDESGLFTNTFKDSDKIHFMGLSGDLDSAKMLMTAKNLYALLHIPETSLSVPETARLYSSRQPNLTVKGYIKEQMRKEIEGLKLEASGIDPDVLKSIKTSVNLLTIKINDGGEEETSSTELAMAVGFIAGLLIYIFIFMYGALVMRGVIEEKTNRIVEVIISSVKPFQLMMGKIVGVAMVGMTQFFLWIVLSLVFISAISSFYAADISDYQQSQLNIQEQIQSSGMAPESTANSPELNEVNESIGMLFESIQSIPFGTIIFLFLFYFAGGYLLYGALFAAIGSAVDSETDTQQFMLPLTVPLIISIVISQFIMLNPDGPAAFWLSIFPLTSPIIMMVRIPFGVPVVDVALSMILLILGFLGTTWLSSRIYRTGILMYGKKINYKELWKWIRYKS